MTPAVDSRLLILDRVRSATARTPDQEDVKIPRGYARSGALDRTACIQLMVERLREYDAEVTECAFADLEPCIVDRLKASEKTKFVAPPGLPAAWQVAGFEWKVDNGLTHEEIEQCDGVVTTASAGVADSGTIVLHHSPREGRRVITLLPDWHLCVLYARMIVETLPEYFDHCLHPPTLATYISGPSATADIEMTRIKGVHGPRFLNVIIVHDDVRPVIEVPTRPGHLPMY